MTAVCRKVLFQVLSRDPSGRPSVLRLVPTEMVLDVPELIAEGQRLEFITGFIPEDSISCPAFPIQQIHS